MDERLRVEREQFALKATCDHCAHFDDDAGACSLTYPTEPHRQSTFETLKDGDPVLFCKTFEVD
ncbi:MAG: hypothetical protein AB2A00_20435 [Myxococcota bacterium]